MRLQLAKPTEHAAVVEWPLETPLEQWDVVGIRGVAGLHRHVVRMIEGRDTSYVIKELPDELVEREWRLLRALKDAGLPTIEVVAVATGRDYQMDGLLITRHLDYSLPYRVLLTGRRLRIPYLGDRMLDALAGLLVRLHLIGFYWGDCSLSNTLFRRDAGALSAYIIDVETGELHESLSDGQRRHDLEIAIEHVAGDLFDLQAGGLLAEGIDPVETALAIEASYIKLWAELTAVEEFKTDETFRVDQRLRRLHDLGFDATELELVTNEDGSRVRLVPCVVEHGFHASRLQHLTGLQAEENQARRLLNDMSRHGARLEQQAGRKLPEAVIAARWLDERFETAMQLIPSNLTHKLEPAELYHQLLEHRWYISEREGRDVGFEEAVTRYVDEVLAALPGEQIVRTGDTGILPIVR